MAQKGRKAMVDKEVEEAFERERRAYWEMREELMRKHFGKWVAVVGGKVAAVGDSKASVLEEAFRRTGSKVGYVTKVGFEELARRKLVRRAAYGSYDSQYDPPIPKISATLASPDRSGKRRVEFVC